MDNSITSNSILAPYISQTVINWYNEASPNKVHIVSKHKGVVICIDASGFTALTRHLSKRGKEGPEILTDLLNEFFEAMSKEVFRFDGDILKFAGDALWCYFPEHLDTGSFFGYTLKALKEVNNSFPITKEQPLKIHVGAELGSFHLASLGDPGIRLEAEPIGKLFEVVMKACDTAGSNQMAIGPFLAEKHLELKQLSPLENGYFELKPKTEMQKHLDLALVEPYSDALISSSILESYLATDVLERIKTYGLKRSLQSEYRQVVVLFSNFVYDFSDQDCNLEPSINKLNSILKDAFAAITNSGGSIARIDPYLNGHKLLVLFGAPVKRENDELNAIKCATRLLKLTNKRFRIRIGLAFGSLFCGDVGARWRKEYTVMGDGINMAARLMSKSQWGKILIDTTLRNRLPKEITTQPVTLSLKGVGDAVVCHRFTGIIEAYSDEAFTQFIVGQRKELGVLKDNLVKTIAGSKQLLIITGETGVGKSTLINKFTGSINNIPVVKLGCKRLILFKRGWLIKKLISDLYDIWSPAQKPPLEVFIRNTLGDTWLPVLAKTLDLRIEDNIWTKGLTPELRNAKAGEMFNKLIEALIDSPRLIIIDDFDKADEQTRALILTIVNAPGNMPLMLVIVARNADFIRAINDSAFKELRLQSPGNDEWRNFFQQKFHKGKKESELFEHLLNASDRNPHFIIEFIVRSVEQNILIPNKLTRKLELSIPGSLSELLLSRFDNLQEIDRVILKAAAASGGGFSTELLSKVLSEFDSSEIESRFNGLAKSGFLSFDPNKRNYNFTHVSMSDVVYSCLPESQLHTLHQQYASVLEPVHAETQPKLLAFHFFRAKLWEKAFRYSLQSAIEAANAYSLNEASHLFDQCLKVVDLYNVDDNNVLDVFTFYAEFNKLLMLEGQFDNAYPILRRWYQLGKKLNNPKEYFAAAVETAHLLWKQSRYSRSRNILQIIISSDLANSYEAILTKAYYIMAHLERRIGNFSEAREYGYKSIELAERISDYRTLIDAYNIIGLAQWGEGKLAEAAINYRKSLEIGKDIDGMFVQAQTSSNLAIIYWEQGDFIAAEGMTAKSVDIFQNIGDKRNEAYVLGNLASLRRVIGKFNSARELFLQADLVFEKLDDKHAHYYIVGNIGDIDLIEGDIKTAEHRFNKVVEFAESVGDKELLSECNVRLGELAFFKKQILEAELKYNEAIEMAKAIKSTEYQIRGYIGLARLLIGKRDSEAALELINLISNMAEENIAVLPMNEAGFLLGEYFRINGQINNAINSYKNVFIYARNQKVFELELKCAVRIYELDPDTRVSAEESLTQLSSEFIKQNDKRTWIKLLNSPYFSYFSDVLKKIAAVNIDFSP